MPQMNVFRVSPPSRWTAIPTHRGTLLMYGHLGLLALKPSPKNKVTARVEDVLARVRQWAGIAFSLLAEWHWYRGRQQKDVFHARALIREVLGNRVDGLKSNAAA